jgi:hypothetical protein
VVHVRELDGKELHFGHRGWLWRNSFVLYDVGTDSIWHHQTGRAMAGPLYGRALPRLPTVLTSWGEWRTAHPGTLVLPKPFDPDVDVDHYATRNAGLSFGIGVELGGQDRLYPLTAFAGDRVLHDTLAGVPVVVAPHLSLASASVFRAELDGSPARFVVAVDADGVRQLAQADGPWRWNLVSGAPVVSSGAKVALAPVPASSWEVGAWTRQHPRGSTFKP